MTHVDNCQLLRVRQVADLLGVHPRSIWRLSASGQLPKPVRLTGRLVRWKRREIEDYLAGLADNTARNT